MHILLTDLLTCPRCGPGFGLILLGDRIENRRVLEGVLGCPNCRERYPVRKGFGDLRAPPRSSLPAVLPPAPADDEETVTRVAALLGVREGPGYLVLAGPVARAAPALAGLLERVEVVTMAPELREWKEEEGVSRLTASPGLPFQSRRIRGVFLDGPSGASFLEEAVRVVGPGGRIVVRGGEGGGRKTLEEGGLEVLVEEEETVVAVRS